MERLQQGDGYLYKGNEIYIYKSINGNKDLSKNRKQEIKLRDNIISNMKQLNNCNLYPQLLINSVRRQGISNLQIFTYIYKFVNNIKQYLISLSLIFNSRNKWGINR